MNMGQITSLQRASNKPTTKLSTLESFYPQASKNNYHETLDPKEKVEMFMTKQRMTFLLQIFYQWRSIAKLNKNSNNTETTNTQNSFLLQLGQQPISSNRSKQPSLQWFQSDNPSSVHKKNKLSETNFFTFHRTAK